jgi:hypothetical protein
MKSCDTMYLLKLATCIIKGELVNPLIRTKSQSSRLCCPTQNAHRSTISSEKKSVNEEELEE